MQIIFWESPCGVVTYVLNSNILVSKFKLCAGDYVHFGTNIPGNDMNSLILPAIG